MNPEELKKELDSKVTATADSINIVDIGRFAIADIESIEPKTFEFKSDEKAEPQRKLRYILKIKGVDKTVIAPITVMMQLKELLAQMPNITHLTVLRSGTGLKTTYQLVPEVQVK
jgi:hypothetical protein